jgi:hypothetical protein
VAAEEALNANNKKGVKEDSPYHTINHRETQRFSLMADTGRPRIPRPSNMLGSRINPNFPLFLQNVEDEIDTSDDEYS